MIRSGPSRVLALLVPLVLVSLAVAGPAAAAVAHVVQVDGVITRSTVEHVEQGIAEAEASGGVVVLELDTPGGLVSSTIRIKEAVFNSPVPVLAWVGPAGAEAASAGSFLLLLGVPNGAAPGSVIGAAHPVTGGGQAAGDKIARYVVGHMESIAVRADRNVTLATAFVAENLTMTGERALEQGMVDALERDLPAFLEAVDGRQAVVAGGNVTLDTAGAEVRIVEPGLRVQLLDLVGNPTIAVVLFMVGLYGLIFGLANPGTYVPETVGIVALVLGIIGLGGVDVGVGAVLLIVVGLGLLVAEVFTPTHGVLTVAGVVALAGGLVLLIRGEPLLPEGLVRNFMIVAVLMSVTMAGVTLFSVGIALRTRRAPTKDSVVGSEAEVVAAIAPMADGKVRAQGAIWTARSDEDLEVGTRVVVTGREGLTVEVERAPHHGPEPPGPHPERP